MKQCTHCGWETNNPQRVAIVVKNDFKLIVYLCPVCYEAYNSRADDTNK